MYIEKNIGSFERVIRLIAGIAILYMVFYRILKGWLGFFSSILAIVEIISASVGYCFFYDLINWCPMKNKINKSKNKSYAKKVPQ